MKKLILSTLLCSSLLIGNQITCDKKVEQKGKKLLSKITISKADQYNEQTNHYISAVSSSSASSFDFLEIDTRNCTEPSKRKLKVYRAIVELFAINQGIFQLNQETVDKGYAERDNLIDSLNKNNELTIPVISENKKYTRQSIQDILEYNKRDIDNIDITELQNKVLDMKRSSTATLEDISKELSAITISLDDHKDKLSTADFLFRIADNKKFYKNISWLAMNFYDSTETISKGTGTSVENTIQIVKSDLLTSDMDDKKNYIYFMDKYGKTHPDKNNSIDYHYFLAEDGVRNPRNELEATLHYFFDPKEQSKQQERVKKYANRYVLLKQLFEKYKVSKFPSVFKTEVDENDIMGHKYDFVYVTSGKEGDEAYGHTMIHINRGLKATNNKPLAESSNDLVKDPSDKILTKKIKSQTVTNENNTSFTSDDLYINFGVPLTEISFLDKIKGLFGLIYGEFSYHTSQTFLTRKYANRLVMEVPITVLDKNISKRILFEANINHIAKHIKGEKSTNKIIFKFPYKFISKNCAYMMSDLLEVPLPELREKFNDESYFSFEPKDMFQLLEGEINVNQHTTAVH